MRKDILNFLSKHCPSQPYKVDRLLISAFLIKNSIVVKSNKLLKSYEIGCDERIFEKVDRLLMLIDAGGVKFDFEELIRLFEHVVSPEQKIVTGAVYTPSNVREYIIDQALKNHRDGTLRIADISCGCGGFLFSAARRLSTERGLSYESIFKKYIYGLDIQGYSITRTKLLLTLLAVSEGEDVGDFSFNLYTGDALKFRWDNVLSDFDGFKIVVGNPPYVCSRNISESTKKLLKNWTVCDTGHPDLYIPFIQIGLENLCESGFLGFITMNTFFKSVNGRALRAYLNEKSYKLKVLDFGSTQIFESKSTYTCILMIDKVHSESLKYLLDEEVKLPRNRSFNTITYSRLNASKGWSLQNIDIISKIESTGIPFGDLYTTRNGIATLKNHIYIFKPVNEDKNYYYLQNGSVYPIEKAICKDIINPNHLVQAKQVDELKEKVIFPYQYQDTRAEVISEKFLKNNYPKAFKYLESKKTLLATRDKGKGSYEKWFAYGRNQSIEKLKHKLFFPHITPEIPNCLSNSDENLLFYNGIAVVTENEDELRFLNKLMRSNLFWYYIKNSSKPYGSGYYSLSRNYIKGFGICEFTAAEKRYIGESDMNMVNDFIEERYGITL